MLAKLAAEYAAWAALAAVKKAAEAVAVAAIQWMTVVVVVSSPLRAALTQAEGHVRSVQ